ncbi:MAG: TonB family protein [Candidatus Azobacteroides sp.]|nr:TonB family protein [Candidatus Azobacteroides sp.]
MTNDVDLTSPKWLNLIFEGKNREYGAYVLREDSSNRHIKALAIVVLVGLALIYLPALIKSVAPVHVKVVQSEGVNFSNIFEEEKEKNQVITPPEVKAVIPPLAATTRFVPPIIVPDNKVKEDDLTPTQASLSENNTEIGRVTVEGVQKGGVHPDEVAPIIEKPVVRQKPFITVEQPPYFDGGEKALLKWVSENMVYPAAARERGIQGLVVLRFVIDPNGSVSDIEILRTLDPSCDKEAVRVVKAMPKWNPGKQNGRAVPVYCTLPIRFVLQNN